METALTLCLGVGLAAACGFRIFVPLLVMSLAANSGHLQLAGGFSWIASRPALAVFAVATVVEIAAYYVPWLDHLLDLAAGPTAVVAGIVVTASTVSTTNPLLHWTLAVIAGGGASAVVQGGTTLVRHVSTFGTLGLGNPIVATVEAGSSVLLSVLALLLPVLAAALVALTIVAVVTLFVRWRSRPRPLPA